MASRAAAHRKKGRRRPWWQAWWPLLAVLALAALAGVAYQGFRSAAPAPQGSSVPAAASAGGALVRGDASAPVLIEEYGDFQCPVCRSWEQAGGPAIQSLVDSGQARFAYHPIAILGRDSVAASNAALCASDGGRFWQYHDLLFQQQGPENSGYITNSRLMGWGATVGAGSGFDQCVTSGRYSGWVAGITDRASQAGINSTPTIFVNGKRLASLDPALLQQMVQSAGR